MRRFAFRVCLLLGLASPASGQWVVRDQFAGNTLLDIDLDVSFETSGTGWILSQQDSIFRTADGGSSWSGLDAGTSGYTPSSLAFVDSATGFIVGSGGGAWRTFTGGDAWEFRNTGTTQYLTDVDFLSDGGSLAWIVGRNETILRTTNVGQTWDHLHGGAFDLYAVDFIDRNNGWAVGEGGFVLHTDVGATDTTWAPQGTPTGANLYDVQFLSATNGWCVGDAGTILSTTTGGTSWTTRPSGTSESLFAESFTDLQNGLAVGTNGMILHTTNGGMSWTSERTSTEVYRDVVFRDLENAWVIGRDTGNLLYSRGGLTVTSPNGGEALAGGTSTAITWTSTYVDRIAVQFTTNDGASWQLAGTGAGSWDASTGSYDWVPPSDVNSTQCRVRLTGLTKALADTSDSVFRLYIPNATSPLIVPSVPEGVDGQDVVVAATITDSDGIQTVELHYRVAGTTGFDVATMSGTGDVYQATIPWRPEGIRGYQYYIRAVDASFAQNAGTWPAGSPQGPPADITVTGIAASRPLFSSEPPNATYQMISVPLSFANNDGSIDAVLGDDMGSYDRRNWALFRWNSTAMQYDEYTKGPVGAFEPGKAFWVASRESGFGVAQGRSVAPEDFSINLSPASANEPRSGWHQIADPFAFRVAWVDVLAASGNPSGFDMPWYRNPETGAYELSDHLEPWTGYFFKNPAEAPGVLVVPAIESTSAPVAQSLVLVDPKPGEWQLQLVVSGGGGEDSFNYCGARRSASVERDEWDHLEPPAIGNQVFLCFPNHDWTEHADDYATDFRPPVGDGESWTVEVTSSLPPTEATLSVKGVSSVPGDLRILLVDPRFHVVQDLRESPVYRFPTPDPGTSSTLELVVGGEAFVAARELRPRAAAGFRLEQNAPNPFRSSTAIRYGMERAGRVRLTVYGVRGERVAVLVDDRPKEAGYHVAVWDGRDSKGRRVASGLYLYRLETGSRSATRKMLVLQ